MSAAAAARKCLLCTIPISVALAALLAFAASAAVEQWRISRAEDRLTAHDSQITDLRDTASDVRSMRRTLERLEAKLDRIGK